MTEVVLPDDIITEILSFLPVKSLLQFRCVCKSWKTLTSNLSFVKLHLNRSVSRNPQFTIVTLHFKKLFKGVRQIVMQVGHSVIPYSLNSLIQNPSFTLSVDPYCCFFYKNYHIVGSCNGLICLSSHQGSDYWFYLWNPATRKTNETFECFLDCGSYQINTLTFNFGFDNATNTYKVLASRYNPNDQLRSNVRILTVGKNDNVWRDIESFPVVPLHLDSPKCVVNVGVYLRGTLNWLAIHNHLYYTIRDITIEQFVIVSLDLGTETYRQYLLPRDFDEVPPKPPTISVLGGCLCFSYSKETYFVIWRMMKYGAEDSWARFLKISYRDLQIHYDLFDYTRTFQLVPLLLYEDGDTIILKSNHETEAIIYNWRDKTVGRTTITTSNTNDSTC